MQILYTAHATATGGRDGRATSSDKALDVALSTPKQLGGAGGAGSNPEQLFAAGYAACFLSAMKLWRRPEDADPARRQRQRPDRHRPERQRRLRPGGDLGDQHSRHGQRRPRQWSPRRMKCARIERHARQHRGDDAVNE